MARSRRRYDILSQPGLFDGLDKETTEESRRWETGDITLRGGEEHDESIVAEPLPPLTDSRREALRYISFGSGSSGNCAFLGNERYGFLIDAGVDGKKVEEDLRRQGIDMFKVVGIILTHDHHDHASHVYSILRNNRHMALYCTPKILNGLLRRHGISRRVKDYHHPIYKEIPFRIKDFELTAFEVSHDGSDNMGFHIQHVDHHFVVATDMGFIGERALYYMQQATALMIESDYDYRMLRTGRYPEYLKARIESTHGHLENSQVAEYLRANWNDRLRNIFLCHLSQDNNTPAKAVMSARDALLEAGASKVGDASEDLSNRDAPVQVVALPRFDASPLFLIR